MYENVINIRIEPAHRRREQIDRSMDKHRSTQIQLGRTKKDTAIRMMMMCCIHIHGYVDAYMRGYTVYGTEMHADAQTKILSNFFQMGTCTRNSWPSLQTRVGTARYSLLKHTVQHYKNVPSTRKDVLPGIFKFYDGLACPALH